MAATESTPHARGTIGAPVPRRELRRLLEGKGCYVDDISLPRTAHAVFVRSPFAHAVIKHIDTSKAAAATGVLHVATGRDIAKLCKPWVGTISHLAGMRSMPQLPLAVDRARWSGEPVAVVVAETRAQAEDGAALVEVDWEELPAVVDEETALDPDSPLIHPELGSNLCWERVLDSPNIEDVFATADAVVEATFVTSRHTHVTLEPRSILAQFNSADQQLTVWHSTQVPHMMHWVLAHHFSLPEGNVRVITPDVGGSFGLKIHVYGDEMTAVALSMLLGRPVKFVADRLESFSSDFHARGHRVRARMAVSATGAILAIDMDDLQSLGPFASYPRGGVNEGRQIVNLVGAAYGVDRYRARTRVVFQNKNMYGQYRSVGHPVACLVTEGLVDRAAAAIGMDPAEFRRKNYVPADAYPRRLVSGPVLESLSQHEALDKLLQLMNYESLRADQAKLRSKGIYRGIGLGSFLEMSNPSSATYGRGGVSIASQDACTIRLMPAGTVFCTASINEIGQGAATVCAQIAATELGLAYSQVRVKLGDTDVAPYGGGNWGSRGTGIGGEAVLQAARALKANVVALAARLIGCAPDALEIRDGEVCDLASGARRYTLAELARIAYFSTEMIPPGFTPELTVSRSYAQRTYDGICTNGIQASYVEVDPETGYVKLLGHWVVEDCGTVINPLLVDEQVRGGVVQGIGAALYEQCVYGNTGQLLNATLVDYHVPLAREMPDIVVAHTCTPTATSELGAKGAGEAGVAGASAAVLNAINDALSPLGAQLSTIPATPQRILAELDIHSLQTQ
jgi:aerobic carbon-monoxide dehydrogenase large subunit